MGNPQVCVSVSGRFHGFNLAQQLLKRGMLNQLITSYPRFETAKYGIPKVVVSSLLSNEVLARGWNRLPWTFRNIWNPQFFLSERFDRLAAKNIKPGANIFVGWSSFSLRGIRAAKKLGMISILERGSTHIVYQRDILREEYEKYGIQAGLPHPMIVEKELKEYNEADYISIPSTFVKSTFIKKGFAPGRLIMAPYGVDISEFSAVKKQDNKFRIIHCGAISLQKGVHYLLKALYELKLPNAELWLVGGISKEIAPFIKKYDFPGLCLKGVFKQSKLKELYSQGSVFCLASLQEGQAMVILQAMACGLPVICTVNTGGGDIIREGIDGFVIPIRDSEALKEKIIFMYENQEKRKEMGKMALKRVRADFTWDAYGDRIINEYTRIAGIKVINA
ncbi:MAG: glycosyltransferase family 4 protein [Candidatus Omnitrophica bacterium]|nr:glycosyltransferase family 4 protein [Candidatus Omnitrophota bacterium]